MSVASTLFYASLGIRAVPGAMGLLCGAFIGTNFIKLINYPKIITNGILSKGDEPFQVKSSFTRMLKHCLFGYLAQEIANVTASSFFDYCDMLATKHIPSMSTFDTFFCSTELTMNGVVFITAASFAGALYVASWFDLFLIIKNMFSENDCDVSNNDNDAK